MKQPIYKTKLLFIQYLVLGVYAIIIMDTTLITYRPITYAKTAAEKLIVQSKQLIERNRLSKASNLIKTGLKYNPQNSALHATYGQILYRQGQIELAVAEEKQAIKLNPRNAEAYWYLGTILFCLGKPQEGADAWRLAFKLQPKYANSKDCNCKNLQEVLKKYPAHKLP